VKRKGRTMRGGGQKRSCTVLVAVVAVLKRGSDEKQLSKTRGSLFVRLSGVSTFHVYVLPNWRKEQLEKNNGTRNFQSPIMMNKTSSSSEGAWRAIASW